MTDDTVPLDAPRPDGSAPRRAKLLLSDIVADYRAQQRAAVDPAVIDDYREAFEAGATFPPVVVFHDGEKHWLADGFCRVEAALAAGVEAILAEIHDGGLRDAILYSVGANESHGLRRTNEDKRCAVMRLLEDEEWSAWSGRDIARQCRVSHPFVSKIKALTGKVSSEVVYTTKHGASATMDTSAIGKKSANLEKAVDTEPPHSAKASRAEHAGEQAAVGTPDRSQEEDHASPLLLEARAAEAPLTAGELCVEPVRQEDPTGSRYENGREDQTPPPLRVAETPTAEPPLTGGELVAAHAGEEAVVGTPEEGPEEEHASPPVLRTVLPSAGSPLPAEELDAEHAGHEAAVEDPASQAAPVETSPPTRAEALLEVAKHIHALGQSSVEGEVYWDFYGRSSKEFFVLEALKAQRKINEIVEAAPP
jgi:hypothetical protein